MKKILFVSSEVSPYAKSGGLADVAGSLPKELLKMGYDISVIMPKYREINCEMEYVTDFSIYMQGKKENCIIRKNEQTVGNKRLITFFVDNITYFDRDGMVEKRGKDINVSANGCRPLAIATLARGFFFCL